MRLRIVKPVKDIDDLPIRVLREPESHQYQFFGDNGFIGRSPCRSTVRKLTPEMVLARAEVCKSDFWEHCNLVDGKGNVLDTMTSRRASVNRLKNIYREIGLYSKDLPEVRG
jgi:hypothetical protein